MPQKELLIVKVSSIFHSYTEVKFRTYNELNCLIVNADTFTIGRICQNSFGLIGVSELYL